jgi:uncharacterized membrane protein
VHTPFARATRRKRRAARRWKDPYDAREAPKRGKIEATSDFDKQMAEVNSNNNKVLGIALGGMFVVIAGFFVIAANA